MEPKRASSRAEEMPRPSRVVPVGLPPIVAFEGLDGAGKSTLLRNVYDRVSTSRRVLRTKLAYDMVSAFQEMFDVEAGRDGRYHDVVPPGFRHGAYVIEAALQFRAQKWRYRTFDLLLFDRWLHTHDAYLEAPVPHEWFAAIQEACIPEPDLVVYVRVEPDVALARLVRDKDWMVEFYGQRALRSRLRAVYERYEALNFCTSLVLDGTQPTTRLTAVVVDAVEAIFADAGG